MPSRLCAQTTPATATTPTACSGTRSSRWGGRRRGRDWVAVRGRGGEGDTAGKRPAAAAGGAVGLGRRQGLRARLSAPCPLLRWLPPHHSAPDRPCTRTHTHTHTHTPPPPAGHPQARPRQPAGAVPGLAGGAGRGHARPRRALRGGQLGEPRAGGLGAGLGGARAGGLGSRLGWEVLGGAGGWAWGCGAWGWGLGWGGWQAQLHNGSRRGSEGAAWAACPRLPPPRLSRCLLLISVGRPPSPTTHTHLLSPPLLPPPLPAALALPPPHHPLAPRLAFLNLPPPSPPAGRRCGWTAWRSPSSHTSSRRGARRWGCPRWRSRTGWSAYSWPCRWGGCLRGPVWVGGWGWVGGSAYSWRCGWVGVGGWADVCVLMCVRVGGWERACGLGCVVYGVWEGGCGQRWAPQGLGWGGGAARTAVPTRRGGAVPAPSTPTVQHTIVHTHATASHPSHPPPLAGREALQGHPVQPGRELRRDVPAERVRDERWVYCLGVVGWQSAAGWVELPWCTCLGVPAWAWLAEWAAQGRVRGGAQLGAALAPWHAQARPPPPPPPPRSTAAGRPAFLWWRRGAQHGVPATALRLLASSLALTLPPWPGVFHTWPPPGCPLQSIIWMRQMWRGSASGLSCTIRYRTLPLLVLSPPVLPAGTTPVLRDVA